MRSWSRQDWLKCSTPSIPSLLTLMWGQDITQNQNIWASSSDLQQSGPAVRFTSTQLSVAKKDDCYVRITIFSSIRMLGSSVAGYMQRSIGFCAGSIRILSSETLKKIACSEYRRIWHYIQANPPENQRRWDIRTWIQISLLAGAAGSCIGGYNSW